MAASQYSPPNERDFVFLCSVGCSDTRSIANMILEGLIAQSGTSLSPSSVLELLQHLQREEMHRKLQIFGVDSHALSTEIVSRLLTQRPVGTTVQGEQHDISLRQNERLGTSAKESNLSRNVTEERSTSEHARLMATQVADDLTARGFAAVLSKAQLQRVLERAVPTLLELSLDPETFNKMVESRLAEQILIEHVAEGDPRSSPEYSSDSNALFDTQSEAVASAETSSPAASSEFGASSFDSEDPARNGHNSVKAGDDASSAERHGDLVIRERTTGPVAKKHRCVREGFDLRGVDLRKVEDGSTGTAEDCKSACLRFPGCNAWTFNSSRRWCYLKRAAEKDFTQHWNHLDSLTSALIDCEEDGPPPASRRLSSSTNSGGMTPPPQATWAEQRASSPVNMVTMAASSETNKGLRGLARSLSAVTGIIQSVFFPSAVDTGNSSKNTLETHDTGFLVRQ